MGVAKKCSKCPFLRTGLFTNLTDEEVEFLDQRLNYHVYKKGQSIFYQGNKPLGLFCVESGIVKLVRLGYHGQTTIFRLTSAGDVIGYRAFFSSEPYTASAEVMEEAGICFFEKAAIDEILKKNFKFTLDVIHKLSHDLKVAEDRFEHLAEYPLRERLAEVLVVFQEHFGTKTYKGKNVLSIKISRREISDLLGVASESVIRMLSAFKKQGLMWSEGSRLALLDESRLRKIAHRD